MPEPDVGQSFSDVFFGFLDEDHHRDGRNTYDSSESDVVDDLDRDDEAGQDQRDDKDNAFWENQHQLLQGTLRRTSSLETGIRKAVKQVVEELEELGRVCGCGKPILSGCRDCLLTEVSGRLGKSGYNTAVCKTKWRSSPNVPSGEHTFLDVVEKKGKGKESVRVIIEVKFRAEFEVARGSEEYEKLLRRLPEVFVGKAERLEAVIKLMCSAAKKCMRQKRMHLGPWRKQAYMHSKWLGPCHRAPSTCPPTYDPRPVPGPTRLNPYPSMLTVDLLDVHYCNAVAVV